MTLPSLPSFLARGLLCLGLALPALSAGAVDIPPTLDKQEQAFVAKATADNSMQIELAKVAGERSTSPQVRELARRIIDDHKALNRKFTAFSVARKAHGQAHGLPSKDVTEDKLRLQRLQGAALDQAFAGMMVAEHQKIIPLYEQAAKDSQDAKLRQLAKEGLPLLREHLRRAQAITAK
ncbi:MAG TPA: DUF4142 domain-containing protein [Frateuria sp.]|uniref:DUF4142 domain-containing protein n=1 Tax=Frateuria sp. TaxID=2211372 RepID=UPI002D810EA8|nr:DUF4142 domain-containing protein [Frateuria sp.]HET6805458.1 DUF4142 domain-containing protein [Frateuria sp.]